MLKLEQEIENGRHLVVILRSGLQPCISNQKIATIFTVCCNVSNMSAIYYNIKYNEQRCDLINGMHQYYQTRNF
jgi:hypothetical protein